MLKQVAMLSDEPLGKATHIQEVVLDVLEESKRREVVVVVGGRRN